MKKVFIFWDNSNIFISAQTVAAHKGIILERSSIVKENLFPP
jgi:hypothetical protein